MATSATIPPFVTLNSIGPDGIETFVDPTVGYVRIRKDLAYPKKFKISKELTAKDGRATKVVLYVETISSGPVVKAVSVSAQGTQVRATDLRFSIDGLLKTGQVMVGKEVTDEGRTRTYRPLTGQYQQEIDDSWPSYIGRPTTLDMDHYWDVSDTYRDAKDNGNNPIPAIARRFNVSESTARRYVETARDKETMGPAIPGRVGETFRPQRPRPNVEDTPPVSR